MFSRRSALAGFASILAVISAPTSSFAQAGKIEVVASFSILADLVRQVGGDRVSVRSIVPANTDAHVYEPKPADVAAVGRAKLVVINGLGFEAWADRIVRAVNYSGEKLVASRGIRALSVRGQTDPHAWQDVANVKVYIANIRDALSKIDPAGASSYASRAASYDAQLDRLDAEIKAGFARIPQANRKVVTSHDAFHYFGDAYDVVFLAPQGVSTEAQPSAKDVGALIRQIKEEGIRAIFIENMTNGRVVQQIGSETGVKVGGTLYADALGGAASSYIAMMRHNARTIAAALAR
ncbi:MAG: ABC transporter substrate-binding protein [Rhizobiales bacterium PAR1]|nr:MAG: ABC transporter substrate-binding protein [Rhizobiales bacterium PAR1]